MLHNEPQEEAQIPALPAAQRRVTPEELTAALETLESSQQEQARQVRDTVLIGEVVQELGLHVTPEEVWRQVQAQRTQKAALPSPLARSQSAVQAALLTARPRQGRRGRILAAVGVGGALFCLNFGMFSHPGPAAVVTRPGNAVTGDNSTTTYGVYQDALTVTGDNDSITLSRGCGVLTVTGDHNKILITGTVRHVITNGDGNTVYWATEKAGQAPSVIDNGDDNHIAPAPDGAR